MAIIQSAMIIPLSILAFSQIVFLPGILINRWLKIQGSRITRIVSIFALSTMVNYLLVFSLVYLNIYTFNSISLILFLEIILIILLYPESISSLKGKTLKDCAYKFINFIKIESSKISSWTDGRLFIYALIIISFAYITYLFINNVGTVFNLWDPIVSWNRWAVEWSTNVIPQHTWEYPQLIPTNWSIFYVLIGTPLQYLSKAIMPLFIIGIILTTLTVGIKRKSLGYLVAIPGILLLMRILNGSAIMATEGYVDTAVAFFAFISILYLLDSRQDESQTLGKKLLVGAIFACGAAMTKQAGLYIVFIYPILAYILNAKSKLITGKKILSYITIYIGIIILLLGPFYIYKEVSIFFHQDVSVIPSITNQVYGGGKSVITQTYGALLDLLKKSYGLILIYFVLVLFALRDREYRYVILAIIIPYTIIWGIAFSYDTRNLSLAMPLIGLGAGIGLEKILTKPSVRKVWTKISTLSFKWILIIGVILILLISPLIANKIFSKYQNDRRQIYDQELSLLISNYFEHNKSGMIYTNYPILYFLPATADRIYSPYGGYSPNQNDFDFFFTHAIDTQVSYIFVADYTSPDIMKYIEQNISLGIYTPILKYKKSALVKYNK